MIKVKYTSPAMAQYPYDVDVKLTYNCEKDGDKYFIRGYGFDREFSLDFIKRMFTPCEEYNWKMLDKEDEKEKEIKTEVKVEKLNSKPNTTKQKKKF